MGPIPAFAAVPYIACGTYKKGQLQCGRKRVIAGQGGNAFMSMFQLLATQIGMGVPMPFDAFDAQGKLLLRKGFVIESTQQLERLLERGLYSEEDPAQWMASRRSTPQAAAAAPLPTGQKVPVFALLAQTHDHLNALLTEARPADFALRVDALAAQLQRCYRLDADAAIASIQMFHGGRYCIRRMVQSAILIELLLSNLGTDADQRRLVMCAALTMNISMLELQDAMVIQNTPPTDAQREAVKAHPRTGAALLRSLGVEDATWLAIVGQHHETVDGQGYPDGLSGAQITHFAQCLSLADRYGAMATGRAYREPALPNVVLKKIFMEKDKSVDATLAGLLVKCVGIYPPGSIVALANGDIAVVVKRTQNANQPVVRCVKTHQNEVLERPRKRLTSEPAYAITRLVSNRELDLVIDPALLWDDGFELT